MEPNMDPCHQHLDPRYVTIGQGGASLSVILEGEGRVKGEGGGERGEMEEGG